MIFGYKLLDAPGFAYRGGKSRLHNFISRWIPKNGNIYCEPFAGRGNVFFLSILFSNYNKYILNDNQTIPFLTAINEYDGRKLPVLTKDDIKEMDPNDPLLLLMEPILYWAGGLKSKTSAIGYHNHDLVAYRNELLKAKHLLLQDSVELSEIDAIECMKKYESENDVFMYLDPPYLSGRVGRYDYDSFDRSTMIELLQDAKYNWLLSEYECDDLNDAFSGLKVFQYNIPIMPSGNKVFYKTEVLYTNMDISKGPNRLNFSYHDIPLNATKCILQNKLTLTKEEFMNYVPDHWKSRTIDAQFNRLCNTPSTYFDGRTLFNLDKLERWEPNSRSQECDT